MKAASFLHRAGILIPIAALLGWSAAAAAQPAKPSLAYARLNQTVRVNGPGVSPWRYARTAAVRATSPAPGRARFGSAFRW